MIKMNESFNSIGIFEIVVRNVKTGAERKYEIRNRVMNELLDQWIDAIAGIAPDLEYKYMAVGTSNTPVTDTDTQLGAELYRVPPVSLSAKTGTGKREMEFLFLDIEAVGHWMEVGIFAGAAATTTPNSGTLITRILWDFDKSADEEIRIRRIDLIERG